MIKCNSYCVEGLHNCCRDCEKKDECESRFHCPSSNPAECTNSYEDMEGVE